MAFDKPQSRNEAILQNMLGANNELEPPKSRVEALLQELSGKMPEANPSEGTTTGTLERLKIGDDIYEVEGGGSGTSDYDALNNKPQIAGVTLSGDKSLADLGIASATTVSGILDGTDIDSFGDVETALGDKVDKVVGKGLSTNDYDDTEKAAVTAATTAIAGIKDGTDIDSFADVETALAGKQGTITAGLYIQKSGDTISVKRDVSEDVDEVLTLTHDTSGGTNKINAVLTVGGETIDSETITTSGGTFHDLVEISFNGQAVRFKFKYLVASKTQSAGYENYIYNEYTDTFVETIGEGNKLIIKSELDTALSGKQDTLTFDDAPTDNSNNPVKSNGIYDALALKQDATDNSLETTDKTIVGAINEHEGDIGSLKSGLTNLDNEVNGDITYPYADVITIEDAVPSNLADCNVKIEPVQDLHGYDKPWVGGASKNLIPLTVADIKASNTTGTWSGNVYTIGTITVEILVDDANNVIGVKVNGTNNGSAIIFTLYRGDMSNVLVAGGTYTITDAAATDGRTQQYENTFTIRNDWYITDVAINRSILGNGTTYNNQIFYPQLETGDHATTFAPYTNICPITGHTEASVQRDGVNLCFRGEGNIYNGGSLIPVNVGDKIYCYGKWTSLFTTNMYGAVFDTANQSDKNTGRLEKFSNFQSGNISVCTVSQKGYFGVCFNSGVTDYEVQEMMISRFPIASATDYEPYSGKTYTIALGDTVYGGTVDFDSGVMTVDRAYAEYTDGTGWGRASGDAGAWFFCYPTGCAANSINLITDKFVAAYAQIGVYNTAWINFNQLHIKPDANIAPSGSTAEGLEEFKTWLSNNHLQVVYPLATPLTVQLTPQQIQLLQGTNTLTASTGDISVTVNGVSCSIGAVQEQANDTNAAVAELAADIADKLPTAPTTDGAYVLTVTVADGTPTYSWESAT